MVPLVVLDLPGLTLSALRCLPSVAELAARGFAAPITALVPAVPAAAATTLLTGVPASVHGIVGSAWYCRVTGGIVREPGQQAWVQHARVWDSRADRRPGGRTAVLGWPHTVGSTAAITVAPYPAGAPSDGPACYVRPDLLRGRLEAELGPCPPAVEATPADEEFAARWLAGAVSHVLAADEPDLTLVSLPLLHRALLRAGPGTSEAAAATRTTDEIAGAIIADARACGGRVIVLSSGAVTHASRWIPVNAALRRAGLLTVQSERRGVSVDWWDSAAFGLTDGRLAHLYGRDEATLAAARAALEALPGVAEVLQGRERGRCHLDHPRAGDLVAVAEAGAAFSADPDGTAGCPAATYGLPAGDPAGEPVLVCSDVTLRTDAIAAPAVADLLLRATGDP